MADQWYVFKLDTGADVTVISSADLHEFRNTTELQPPDRQLCGPSSVVLPVAGCFSGTLQYKDRITEETIYVVKQLQTSLLRRPAITRLTSCHDNLWLREILSNRTV